MKTITLISDDYQGHVDYTRHACRGIVVNDNKVLLCYETKEDKYLIPGGGVEECESYIDCLKRELEEETGYLVSSKEQFLEVKEYFYWDKNWEHIQHYFICDVVDNTKSTKLTKAEEEAGVIPVWVSLEEAIEIFSRYPKYIMKDKATSGLYKRELCALQEYMKYNKKS
ncbi:MAG: NUDIX domain-containing protein [Bacillales bacterium]|nr:NUDIX domain-containing protein [Bacillales bacterium]